VVYVSPAPQVLGPDQDRQCRKCAICAGTVVVSGSGGSAWLAYHRRWHSSLQKNGDGESGRLRSHVAHGSVMASNATKP
jgi:hypothetical protein